MPEGLMTIGYLSAGIFFILSLGGLAHPETARRGNLFGILGMGLALLVTVAYTPDMVWWLVLVLVAGGGGIGAVVATRVMMTAMPQLVAILHSFVGLAAVLAGMATHLTSKVHATPVAANIHAIEIFVAVAIGALTFTGSIIAWAKLSGRMSGKPLLLPGRHMMNLGMLVGLTVLGILYVQGGDVAMTLLLANAILSGVLGAHLVLAIGGADMPVVVSLLNSYSGWAAAAGGFMVGNDLLIITGALVGSSGAILSYIMCRGMNRSIWNVAFGGFGTGDSAAPVALDGEVHPVDVTNPLRVAEQLRTARKVVIVPGYGMAVARAQKEVSELTRRLRGMGVTTLFGVHPVAGRMPGHMNVLLAEVSVPYDIVLEQEDINDELSSTDVVLVVGANDIVNPDALDNPDSPIAGMPQIEVWEARHVVVLKRGMSPGYAGVENPLFFRENTSMLFGDAADSVGAVLEAL